MLIWIFFEFVISVNLIYIECFVWIVKWKKCRTIFILTRIVFRRFVFFNLHRVFVDVWLICSIAIFRFDNHIHYNLIFRNYDFDCDNILLSLNRKFRKNDRLLLSKSFDIFFFETFFFSWIVNFFTNATFDFDIIRKSLISWRVDLRNNRIVFSVCVNS